ncbi:MAG: 4Fe-4S double cluster binding domain-containing protein [Candidatus Thorarchaeota archaeon]|nr:4Fe-4S double cluster binding domain-containing protein [Candidatus Thorarchaeota archaeon]
MANNTWEPMKGDELPSSLFKYQILCTKHLHELQDDFEVLDTAGKISHNTVFRSYVGTNTHELPASFLDAKSIVIIAVFTPLLTANFHYNGESHQILVPHYYEDGITEEHLKNTIKNQIIGHNGYRIENAKTSVLLKRLAVRSGLGRYGRNNLCYVDGFGSFVRLHAFFTDFEFEEDNWIEAKIMDSCEKCKICQNNCPTGSINDENFVIDIEKCIPLYNEIPGEFPWWINPESHNALMGCMKCQLICPANNEVVKLTQTLEDVSEEETKALLEGNPTDDQIASLSKKTKMFIPEHASYYVPVLSRNLRALIGQ